ncbi:ParB/Srx family N-terminal domain-containing protein [Acinetobacter sp. HY1485]|uniref:ParB/Srx family N-terminal domain-containing protein n=1 Tax=Acinetobacter sp. HY1485 TaxID=2970918 RepID=UPI0022B9CD66|nr:ParB/Srx family N-terminal domain-containing protein [Acinetobacter sp. HY1485]
MKLYALAIALFSSVCIAETAPVNIVKLDVSALHPTQPRVGYRQIAYKIHGYKQDTKKIFDNYCENIGAGKLKTYSETSNLKDINSFECEAKVATHIDAMKTVVQAPNGQYYLTDGHHFVSEIAQVVGQDVPVFMVVTPDMSYVKTMRQFSKEMQKKRLTWLKDDDKSIKFDQLPQNFSSQQLKNDEYRSLMFFLRNIAFDKPEIAPPFYEFFMADWIRKQVPLNQLNLTNAQDYAQAVQKVGQAMVSANPSDVVAKIDGKVYTVKDFGIFQKFNQEKYNSLLQPNSKLYQAFE